MIPNTQKEYKEMMGLDQKDYGSRAVIKRDVIRYGKSKGYRTTAFHKMPKSQLREIALKYAN